MGNFGERFFILKKLRLFDYIFIILFLFTGIFLCVKGVSQHGAKVVVNAGGKQYEYSANQNGVYEVEGPLGKTLFEIQDGRVRITDSPCPHKTCVNQGWHTPLVCLPNDVIISVQDDGFAGQKQGGFDAISE